MPKGEGQKQIASDNLHELVSMAKNDLQGSKYALEYDELMAVTVWIIARSPIWRSKGSQRMWEAMYHAGLYKSIIGKMMKESWWELDKKLEGW